MVSVALGVCELLGDLGGGGGNEAPDAGTLTTAKFRLGEFVEGTDG